MTNATEKSPEVTWLMRLWHVVEGRQGDCESIRKTASRDAFRC